jgi:hypothetical protein
MQVTKLLAWTLAGKCSSGIMMIGEILVRFSIFVASRSWQFGSPLLHATPSCLSRRAGGSICPSTRTDYAIWSESRSESGQVRSGQLLLLGRSQDHGDLETNSTEVEAPVAAAE